MKKPMQLMAIVTCLLLVTSGVFAQTTNPVYTVQTRYLKSMMDSTERAALASLLQEYHQKVTMKNELILSEKNMWHYYTDDSREFVIITEYADWSSIEKAGDRDDQLISQAWPDVKLRTEFMKKMDGYFTHHKDAIFSGMPKLAK